MPTTVSLAKVPYDTLQIRVRVEGSLEDPAVLGEAIDALVRETADLDSLLLRGPEFATEGNCFYFFEATVEGGTGETLTEQDFFARTAQFPELDARTLAYLANIMQFNQAESKRTLEDTAWHDEEYPAGTFAIEPLALRERRYVNDYAAFLATNDMGHEVNQGEFIDRLVAHWGWCDETLKVAALRLGAACGQSGDTQFADFCQRGGLLNYLAENDKYDDFARFYVPHDPSLLKQPQPGADRAGAVEKEWDLLTSIAEEAWDARMQEALRRRLNEMAGATFRASTP